MAKNDRFYFDNFITAAGFCCSAAEHLEDCFNNYDFENIKGMIETMHNHEHSADLVRHEMTAALAKAFVTPLEREDMAQISNNIDEVADTIEEVLQRFYMDEIREVLPQARVFAAKVSSCCRLMKQVLVELPGFKKPQKLHEMIRELNHMEEECDVLYLQSMREVLHMGFEPLQVIAWRDIFYRLERCADACEHVADTIETIVMKNT